MSDKTDLVKDLLGKFDIENVFCKILPFPGSDKDIFYHQTTKGKIYIIFSLQLYNMYLQIMFIVTVMIYNIEYYFTRPKF